MNKIFNKIKSFFSFLFSSYREVDTLKKEVKKVKKSGTEIFENVVDKIQDLEKKPRTRNKK